jgi:phosphatidylglycerol:prolipoprotein diacylglycerol transferase
VTAAASAGGDEAAAALVVSHWFDTGPAAGPGYTAIIRVTGRRRGVVGRPTRRDAFSHTETVPGVVPGSGRVSTTSWIYDIAPGDWDVTAELMGPERARAVIPDVRLPRAAWSWRTWSLGRADGPVKTRWAVLAPLVAIPAVLPGSFMALAVLAIITAIASQPVFLARLGLDTGAGILASVSGLLLGLGGAKAWYMGLKGPSRRTLKEGWSVDGFLVTAPVAAVVVAMVQGVPVAAYLDAVAPGMFLAVAIGRVGCFLTGCCAGRVTSGRGLWSSDRRVGAKRIPAQLMESAVGLILATITTIALLGHVAGGSGMVFAFGLVAYAVARQGLLRLRAETRSFSWRRAGVAARA